MNKEVESVEQYIEAFPSDIKSRLEELRATIIATAPDASESISYGMPAYKTNGRPLVYFAAGHTAFADELSAYKQGKGSVQFPLDQALPLDLIKRMVEFRVRENELK